MIFFEITTEKECVIATYNYRDFEISIEKIIKDAKIFLRWYPGGEKVSFEFANSRYSVSRVFLTK